MKYCVIVPDGAADYPLGRLEGKTPLEVAHIANMDRAAREGLLGVTTHVPPRMPPGSAVAIMSVVGYDPLGHYTGRGPLEAADLGVEMGPHDWAVRCNLVTVRGDVLADFAAGHIATEEAEALIQALNEELGTDEIRFHTGAGYRHVMVYRGAENLDFEIVPPHDMVGQPIRDALPTGANAAIFVGLMQRSAALLESHEVNQARRDRGERPANMIWLWGQGVKPHLDSFESRFGVKGSVISAVKLVRGIGRLIGWQVIDVPGATGYVDTDYAAKGRHAVDALRQCDFVLVHIEAPDEASHEGSVVRKMQALEQIDSEIVGPVMARADESGDLRVLIMPDHITSVRDGRHKRGLVPFAMWGAGIRAASGLSYAEPLAEATEVQIEAGHDLMKQFIE